LFDFLFGFWVQSLTLGNLKGVVADDLPPRFFAEVVLVEREDTLCSKLDAWRSRSMGEAAGLAKLNLEAFGEMSTGL